MLPAPHESVRIEVGPLGLERLYVAYEGTRDALLACGAIDALMAMTLDGETAGRDIQLRPCTQRLLSNGLIRITRTVSSMKKAADLPGVRGDALQLTPAVGRRVSHLSLIRPKT